MLNMSVGADRNVRDLSGTSLRLRQSMTPKITDAVKPME